LGSAASLQVEFASRTRVPAREEGVAHIVQHLRGIRPDSQGATVISFGLIVAALGIENGAGKNQRVKIGWRLAQNGYNPGEIAPPPRHFLARKF
jgi:hypothetical protein